MNIIKKLEELSNANGWLFVHSTEFGQNLFDEILETNQTVLMIESPLSFSDDSDKYGNLIKRKVSINKCQLLRSSDISEPIGNATGYSHDSGRYSKIIEPLKNQEINVLRRGLSECDCKLTQFKFEDVYNILDYNLDGLLINFIYECD